MLRPKRAGHTRQVMRQSETVLTPKHSRSHYHQKHSRSHYHQNIPGPITTKNCVESLETPSGLKGPTFSYFCLAQKPSYLVALSFVATLKNCRQAQLLYPHRYHRVTFKNAVTVPASPNTVPKGNPNFRDVT